MAIAKIIPQGNVVSVTAGEDVLAGDYVFIALEAAPYTWISNIVPGSVYRTTTNVRARSFSAICLGFVLKDTTSGNTARVQTNGLMTLPQVSGILPGRYLVPGPTYGSVMDYYQTRSSHEFPVAQVVSPGVVKILPQPWNLRGKTVIMCGQTGSYTNAIETKDFSTDTAVQLIAVGTQSIGATSGSASSLKMYRKGGYTGSSSNVVDGLVFSNETCSQVSTLTAARQDHGSASSQFKTYTCNGTSNTNDYVKFADETAVSVTSFALSRSYNSCGASNVKLYNMGGSSANVDALPFATETSAANICQITSLSKTSTSQSGLKVFRFSGGASTTHIIPFATDTPATTTAPLAATSWNSASSSPMKSYVNGGDISNRQDTIHFSTETWMNLPNFIVSRRETASGAS